MRTCKTEIGQFNLKVLCNQDVRELQVAVHHPVLSDRPESSFQFQHHMSYPRLREGASAVGGEIGLQVGALAVLKDKVQVAGSLLEVQQRHDVLMLDEREHRHLLLDALQLLSRQVLKGYLLDCEPTTRSIACLEDRRVGPLTNNTQQNVRTDLATLFTTGLPLTTALLHQKFIMPHQTVAEAKGGGEQQKKEQVWRGLKVILREGSESCRNEKTKFTLKSHGDVSPQGTSDDSAPPSLSFYAYLCAPPYVYPAAQMLLQQSNHSHVMRRRVFLVERFIHMLIVIRIFTTHLFPTEYFLPFVLTMLVLQHHKEGLTPVTILLLPLLALQVWAQLSGMEQLQYVVAILGGVLHFLPMRVYWLPKGDKVVGYREDSLQGGLHYCQFHPLQGETKLKSIRWHREKEVAKMLQHQGFTNKLVKKLGHLILSYVNHYHLQVAEGKEKQTGSAIAFCHGRGGTPFMYSSYLMHFAAKGYRVGAIQHTEKGKTDLVGKEVIKKFREREVQVRAAEYYQTIVEVSKGKQRLVLMGHSYGCATVIQAYHSLQPEIKAKVSQLILLDPWFFPLSQAKFAQEISCSVLILANEDFLMNPDMYQRNDSYVKQHKLQYIIWRQGHHNHQTDFGFISGNLLGAVKNHHLSKLFLELNITAIERFLNGERVEGTFGDRELGREWKPEKFYPENAFNM